MNVWEQMKQDLRAQPLETVKQSTRVLKQELVKYREEIRDGFRQGLNPPFLPDFYVLRISILLAVVLKVSKKTNLLSYRYQ